RPWALTRAAEQPAGPAVHQPGPGGAVPACGPSPEAPRLLAGRRRRAPRLRGEPSLRDAPLVRLARRRAIATASRQARQAPAAPALSSRALRAGRSRSEERSLRVRTELR